MAVELPVTPTPGYAEGPLPPEIDPAIVAANLRARWSYADGWRKQYDERAIEWYKLYIGWREELTDERGNPVNRSNMHIPRTYEQMDTWRARLIKAFWSSHPYIDFLPQPRRDGQQDLAALNDGSARVAAALLDQQLDLNQITRVFYDWATQLLVFPAAIMAVGWRYEQRLVRRRVPMVQVAEDGTPFVTYQVQETPETVWDDNEIRNVDYFDFWPDPRGSDIDSCRFVFHREWLTRDALEERLQILANTGLGTVYPLNWEDLREAGSGLEEGRWDRMSAVGLAPETRQGHWDEDEPQTGHTGEMVEVLHYWEDERHAILVNRQALAYDGPNPYWRHGKKPFVVQSFEPLPNQFYGMSAVQIIEHLQHETNTQRNQRIDNVAFVLNRQWKVLRGADIAEDELVSEPGGIIHVDTPDDVTPMEMVDVTSSAYQEEAITKQDMENVIGTPPVVRGVGDQRRGTATEIVTQNSNASIRFDTKIIVYETAIKRLAYLCDCNNQQFIDTPRAVRLFGDDGAITWQWMEPGALVGEYDYRPSGSSIDPAANKEVRRQQLTEMMQTVLATQNPFIDRYQLTKMWVESFDVRSAEKLLLNEQVVYQQMAQMAAEQQALQAQQALAGAAPQDGRGEPPAPRPNPGGGGLQA